MSLFKTEGDAREVNVESKGGGVFVVRVGETEHTAKVVRHDGAALELELEGGRRVRAQVARDKRGLFVFIGGTTHAFTREEASAGKKRARAGHEPGLEAPMPGQIRAVAAALGAEVAEGDTLVVLEAMKMELRVKAPHAGKVVKVLCKVGDVVERGQILVELNSLAK